MDARHTTTAAGADSDTLLRLAELVDRYLAGQAATPSDAGELSVLLDQVSPSDRRAVQAYLAGATPARRRRRTR